MHTIKPGQIIVFLHYNWYIICHIYILCQWDSDVICPGKGVYGHYCLVKIIKIIDKITFSFLTVFSTLFILLYFSYLAVFQKVIKLISQFLFKDKKQSGTYFVKWKNNIINYNSFWEKKKKKIQYETKITFFLWVKWKSG